MRFLQRSDVFNVFVAAEIARRERVLSILCEALREAALFVSERHSNAFIEELVAHPGRPVSSRALNAAGCDDAVIELLCERYLQTLKEQRRLADDGFDAVLLADMLLHWVCSSPEFDSRPVVFSHNWRIKPTYLSNGWHITAPLLIALGVMPSLEVINALHRAISKRVGFMERIPIEDLLGQAGVANCHLHRRYARFLVLNSDDLTLTRDRDVISLSGCLPEFALLAFNSDWIFSKGLGWANRWDTDVDIAHDERSTRRFLTSRKRADLWSILSPQQLAATVIIKRQAGEAQVQGLGASLHNEIFKHLAREERVLNVSQLRHLTGLSSLRLNPFAILPGPIVVYAPSLKFLKSDAVTLALRDWVQQPGRQRAKISPDRILTPLRNVVFEVTVEDLLACVRKTSTFRVCQMVFWKEIRASLRVIYDLQAKEWAEYHLFEGCKAALKKAGFFPGDGTFFLRRRWGHIEDGRACERAVRNELAGHDTLGLTEVDRRVLENVIERLSPSL